MDQKKKAGRYQRIYTQLAGLLTQTDDKMARMATVAAVLHHKMEYFFWTGFYTLREGKLMVGPYQGPVACQVLKKDTGVCWAGINQDESQLVKDVADFPGHIACDSRSQSEIVIPLRDAAGRLYGVLDVDSSEPAAFDEVDREGLERIVGLI